MFNDQLGSKIEICVRVCPKKSHGLRHPATHRESALQGVVQARIRQVALASQPWSHKNPGRFPGDP